MGSDIDLRAPRPEDRAAWEALWRVYLAFYETELAPEALAHAFDRVVAGDGTVAGRIAWDGGRAVGLVHWLFHAHLWRPEGVCYLQDLYTVPDKRGRGVGRALIEAVYAAADARGAPRVYWLTQSGNRAGRALYDRVGRRTDFIRYDRPAA